MYTFGQRSGRGSLVEMPRSWRRNQSRVRSLCAEWNSALARTSDGGIELEKRTLIRLCCAICRLENCGCARGPTADAAQEGVRAAKRASCVGIGIGCADWTPGWKSAVAGIVPRPVASKLAAAACYGAFIWRSTCVGRCALEARCTTVAVRGGVEERGSTTTAVSGRSLGGR